MTGLQICNPSPARESRFGVGKVYIPQANKDRELGGTVHAAARILINKSIAHHAGGTTPIPNMSRVVDCASFSLTTNDKAVNNTIQNRLHRLGNPR